MLELYRQDHVAGRRLAINLRGLENPEGYGSFGFAVQDARAGDWPGGGEVAVRINHGVELHDRVQIEFLRP